MLTFGYARVSTDGQSLGAQRDALVAAGCAQVFAERASGTHRQRPELVRLLALVDDYRPGDGVVVVVTHLDRLARNVADLLHILDRLTKAGAALRSLGDPWLDTSTPAGRFMATMLGSFAEFERSLIVARTGEGRAKAKAAGKHMGRPASLSVEQQNQVRQAIAEGASQADQARLFGVSAATVSRMLAAAGRPIH